MPRRRVALLIETSNSYARQLLQGVRAWMHANEPWSVRLMEQGRGAGVPAWLRGWRGDGVIARVENASIAEALAESGLPVIDVSAALDGPLFPRVVTDSEAATRMAFEHLWERGLRHFAFCGDPQFRWAELRGDYFSRWAREAGCRCAVFRDFRRKPDAELAALARWLRGLPRPVGVLACYDIRGQQVLEACREAGLRVPDEVAVIGIHNDELLCELCDPPLSSVAPDARRAGYEAAALLARWMNGEAVPREQRQIEPLRVVTRQSTDVVAVDDPQVAAALRYIRRHATEGIGVADVLRAVPMARTSLERRFRRSIGCTPREQIEKTRLEHVKTLLGTTDLPVARIAELTGFTHPEYLTVVFRRATGTTPRHFREKHRARGG
ncbi:MAG: helix-turn-helix domain-containing protein [Verrucomicrobia bacterium]|nr:MAG: helix-turn-helix domain-containing protein [Verrucomicrobiota bacterium]